MPNSDPTKPLILLVEDHDDSRQMYAEFLGQDYDVLEASRGRDALALMKERPPALLITDLSLPDFDGYELVRRMREESGLKDIPVICLSGYGGPACDGKAVEFNRLLQKPCLPDTLADAVAEVLKAPRATRVSDMSARKVLIVEDDADTREMLGRFLELEGFEVETAANGRQALDCLEAGSKACVIVLDLMMPVMDGWQFRREQCRRDGLARIPVIVVSAAGRDRISQIDADAYLSKPVDLEELRQRIDDFRH